MDKATQFIGLSTLVVRLVIGGVFIYAGVTKIFDPAAFAEAIQGYRLTTYRLAYFMALYLPFLEILCGALLIAKRTSLPAATIATALMAVFTLALITAWARGLDIDCGCFGKSDTTTNYPMALIKDALLLGCLGYLLASEKHLTLRRKAYQSKHL